MDKYHEAKHLAIFVTGKVNNESWYQQEKEGDFFFVKNIVYSILKRLGLDESRFAQEQVSGLVLETGVRLSLNNKPAVEFGVMSKKLLHQFDIRQAVFMANFNWDLILQAMKQHKVSYKPVTKFPEVRRDLALVVDKEVEFETLKKIAFDAEKYLLKQVNLFDVYEGEKIGQGKKSYALSFILQDEQKTFTDQLIDKTMAKIQKMMETKAGAVLR